MIFILKVALIHIVIAATEPRLEAHRPRQLFVRRVNDFLRLQFLNPRLLVQGVQVSLLRVNLPRQPRPLLRKESMLHSIYFGLAPHKDDFIYHILHSRTLHMIIVR